jgi:hypothetical protein
MKASKEDTSQGERLRRRSYEMAFGGLPYTKMIRIMIEPVMYARELGNHPDEMKFHLHLR